jgi:Spy/CpxP family protein refolding chaperone
MVMGVGGGDRRPEREQEIMTDSNDTLETQDQPIPARRRGRRWLFVALPAVLIGGGLLGAQAYAFGPGGRHGNMSPEQMQKFAEKRVERVLDQVDATDDQRARIKGTLSRLIPEMKALHDEKAKLHEAGKKALLADNVDAAEVERLRREVLRLADKGTTLVSRAVVEVATVLRPDQRKELFEHIEEHRGRRWH